MDEARIRTTLSTPDPKLGTHGAISEGLCHKHISHIRVITTTRYLAARICAVVCGSASAAGVPVAFPHVDLEAAGEEPAGMVEQRNVAPTDGPLVLALVGDQAEARSRFLHVHHIVTAHEWNT